MLFNYYNADDLISVVNRNKENKKSVGFVPTMGALHEGHKRLIRKCKRQNDLCIVSIFVNPTQFDNPEDFLKYPQNLNGDIFKLIEAGADILFAPSVLEIYPNNNGVNEKQDLGGLDTYMEGKFRPGHFNGVAQVVKRLLEIVNPDKLYMGQKDFQQTAIVRHLLTQNNFSTELVLCPTVREPNGLAMSSRNERLKPEIREKASIIYKALTSAKKDLKSKPVEEVVKNYFAKLNTPPFKPDYFEVVDGYTLLPVSDVNQSDFIVLCTAVWAENVRLIDNIIIKP